MRYEVKLRDRSKEKKSVVPVVRPHSQKILLPISVAAKLVAAKYSR